MSKQKHPSGAQIIAARERAGLTQAQAAEICCTPKRTYAGWEGGETKMHRAIWLWFCHVLDENAGSVMASKSR
jgi:DNA-binding transcriptional regulator YiaG